MTRTLSRTPIPRRALLTNRTPSRIGIPTEFDQLVRAEHDRLRRLAWRFGVPAHELDDAVQDVFLRAWAGYAGFRGEASARTWLTRVAVNTLTSRRRVTPAWKTSAQKDIALSDCGRGWCRGIGKARARRSVERWIRHHQVVEIQIWCNVYINGGYGDFLRNNINDIA